jgi:lipopolysaccharide transport system ATP-binding protein
MAITIRAESLSKDYQLGATTGVAYGRLTESLWNSLTRPFSAHAGRGRKAERIWALRDVSFNVHEGDVVGIVGRNGAGKTTLLRLLSRITEPTSGRAHIYGRVGSLLEVGTGFHPELTGRENIFLSGAILGMRKAEIRRKLDEIVDFSGVERFIDTPVKRYSSGMYVRLAFSVAAHLQPEILLIDEVLAVGDAAFQKKSLGKMSEVAHEGRTVLFVSHGMGAVRSLCTSAIWLENGRVAASGSAADVVSAYLDDVLEVSDVHRELNTQPFQRHPLEIEDVVLFDSGGRPTSRFPFGSDICVEVRYSARDRIEHPHFWIGIGEDSSIFGAINLLDGGAPGAIEGRGRLRCLFRNVTILPRFYNVFLGVQDETTVSDLVSARTVAHLEVTGEADEIGFDHETATAVLRSCAPVVFPYEWQHPDGSRVEVDPAATAKEADGLDR